jgi:hypothetical protein
MSRLESSGFDQIYNELRRLGDGAAPVVEEMLNAGAEVVRQYWKETAEKHHYRASGEMIKSIDVANRDTMNMASPDAAFREIYPQGKDPETGVRNAEKAYILHYGTSRIQASYWVDEAEAAAQEPLNAAMRAVWDDFQQGRNNPA